MDQAGLADGSTRYSGSENPAGLPQWKLCLLEGEGDRTGVSTPQPPPHFRRNEEGELGTRFADVDRDSAVWGGEGGFEDLQLAQ